MTTALKDRLSEDMKAAMRAKDSARLSAIRFLLAAINEFIWRSFSTETWIASKMFVSFPATMIFAFLQIPLLKRHWVGDDNPFG